MADLLEALDELRLVERDFLGLRILAVTYSAIGELVPVDFELTEDLLQLLHDLFNPPPFTCNFEVVNVDGDEAEKLLPSPLPIPRFSSNASTGILGLKSEKQLTINLTARHISGGTEK